MFLLSVCGPPAPRIEEPFDGEDDTGNRCSQQFILDSFYPAGLALILRTPTESGRKSPVFWYGAPRGWAVRRQLGDKTGIVRSLIPLHYADVEWGDYAAARARMEESLAVSRELGDPCCIAYSLAFETELREVALVPAKECRNGSSDSTKPLGELHRT